MDFSQSQHHQWRKHQHSDDLQYQTETSAKSPKLQHVLQQQEQKQEHPSPPPAAALALSLHEPDSCNNNKATTTTTSSCHSTEFAPTRFSSVGSFFSLAQWQELELQALIYKYMLAGASVPLELILPIKRSLLNAPPLYQHYSHFQPTMLQGGYWGRCMMDPEPGRCRRTDGKKWRCSKEVVSGHKYCERHVHRGRNRSRKPVEITTATTTAAELTATATLSPWNAASKTTPFALAPSPPLDTLHLNHRPPDGLKSYHHYNTSPEGLMDGKSDGQVLRHFFDDWPTSHQEQPNDMSSSTTPSSVTSTSQLSISIPGNHSSDFSLKLSTGGGENSICEYKPMQPPPINWSGWAGHGEASLGGPLAEALRSSTSSTTPSRSPTTVLQKPICCVSEASSIIST